MRTGFRLLMTLGLLVLGGVAVAGCKEKKAQPFSCHSYQKRMERCENDVLGALKKRYTREVKSGFRKAAEAEAQFKMLQWRVRKRIRHRNSLRLCEKLAKLRAPHYRKQYSTMKYCFRRKGCAAFAECMLSIL